MERDEIDGKHQVLVYGLGSPRGSRAASARRRITERAI